MNVKDFTPEELVVILNAEVKDLKTERVQADADILKLRVELDVVNRENERLLNRIQNFDPAGRARHNEILEFWAVILIALAILSVLVLAAADLGPFGARQ